MPRCAAGQRSSPTWRPRARASSGHGHRPWGPGPCCGGAGDPNTAGWRPGAATGRGNGGLGGWEGCAAVPTGRLGTLPRELDEIRAAHDLAARHTATSAGGLHAHAGSTSTCSANAGRLDIGSFVEQAVDLVVRGGGSVSGEHGDGRARSGLLAKMYGADLCRDLRGDQDGLGPGGGAQPACHRRPGAPGRGHQASRQRQDRALATAVLPTVRTPTGFAQAQRRCVGVGEVPPVLRWRVVSELSRSPRAGVKGLHPRAGTSPVGKCSRAALWTGRQLRLRTRPLRGVPSGGGEGPPASRPSRPRHHGDRRRRIQLPHPDRTGDRSQATAPGPGPCLGVCPDPGRTRRSRRRTRDQTAERSLDRPPDHLA